MNKFEWIFCGATLIFAGVFGFEAGPLYGAGAIFLGVICIGMANKKKSKRYEYLGSRQQHFFKRK